MTPRSQNNQNRTTQTRSTNPEYERKRIERLFLRFATSYGYLWQNLFQSDFAILQWKEDWETTLQPYDNQTVKEAIALCLKISPRPPTLPEFVGFCKNANRKNNLYQPEKVARASPEVAKYHLQKMKAILHSHSR